MASPPPPTKNPTCPLKCGSLPRLREAFPDPSWCSSVLHSWSTHTGAARPSLPLCLLPLLPVHCHSFLSAYCVPAVALCGDSILPPGQARTADCEPACLVWSYGNRRCHGGLWGGASEEVPGPPAGRGGAGLLWAVTLEQKPKSRIGISRKMSKVLGVGNRLSRDEGGRKGRACAGKPETQGVWRGR